MSSRRRLVSGSSSRRTHTSRTAENSELMSLDLPPYELPTCPLNDQGKQALRELSSARIHEKFKTHLDESGRLLTSTVYDTLERVALRKRQAANIAEREGKKRRVHGANNEVEDRTVAAEQTAKDIESKVSPLTLRLEKSMREVLDMEAAMQDQKQTLQDLPRLVAQAQEVLAENNSEHNADDDVDLPEIAGIPILALLESERDKKAAIYDELGMQAKYAQHNSYIDFRRGWNDGVCFEQDVSVPDPSTWFDEHGRPQHVVGGQSGDETDDDIQIAGENKSFRCPLSLAEISEPYTCRRCGHSFQKKSILHYLNVGKGGAPAPCPMDGCQLRDITFKDFYFDRSLLRQIKRSHQTEWRADSSEVDVREGDEEGENENENETEIETALKPKDEEGNDD